MRFLRLFFLLTLLSTFFHSKDSHAGFENPVARGFTVSGGSFVLAGLGVVAGGYLGARLELYEYDGTNTGFGSRC